MRSTLVRTEMFCVNKKKGCKSIGTNKCEKCDKTICERCLYEDLMLSPDWNIAPSFRRENCCWTCGKPSIRQNNPYAQAVPSKRRRVSDVKLLQYVGEESVKHAVVDEYVGPTGFLVLTFKRGNGQYYAIEVPPPEKKFNLKFLRK